MATEKDDLVGKDSFGPPRPLPERQQADRIFDDGHALGGRHLRPAVAHPFHQIFAGADQTIGERRRLRFQEIDLQLIEMRTEDAVYFLRPFRRTVELNDELGIFEPEPLTLRALREETQAFVIVKVDDVVSDAAFQQITRDAVGSVLDGLRIPNEFFQFDEPDGDSMGARADIELSLRLGVERRQGGENQIDVVSMFRHDDGEFEKRGADAARRAKASQFFGHEANLLAHGSTFPLRRINIYWAAISRGRFPR